MFYIVDYRTIYVVFFFIYFFTVSCYCVFYFFFSSRRRHTRFDCDWSSDVCSSDLLFAGERRDLLDLFSGEGILLFARRKALDRRPGRHEPDPGEQWLRIHRAERMPHAYFAGIDDNGRGAEDGDRADRERDVAEQAQDAADRTAGRGLAPHGGSAETEEESNREEYKTKD